MLKRRLLVGMSVLVLGSGVIGWSTQAEPVAAKSSVYQKIPKAYRGTWKLKKSTWKMKKKSNLVIKSRSVKASMVSLKGKSLGVQATRKSLAVFQIAKGKQVGEGTSFIKTHYHGKKALKVSFDTCVQYYTK